MTKISVVINTLNEEENIKECIDSVINYVDEIIVCDMYSDDDTVNIAKNLGAKIIFHKRIGYVEPARNYAIKNAKNEWILILDADERLTPNLGNELLTISQKSDDRIEVVKVWILYWYFGDWIRHGGFFKGDFPRFFKKNIYLDSYTNEESTIHNNFINLKNNPKSIQLNSDLYIKHYAYRSVDKYIRKTIYKYSLIEAKNMKSNGVKFSYAKMVLSPIKQFIVRLIFKKGYKEGIRGFILISLFSIHRFCVWTIFWHLKKIDE